VTWDHPQNEKASLEEQRPFGGFTFKTFEWRFFHGQLQKVKVVLKVYRVTELFCDYQKE
jgi:hypothetical protein